MDNVRRRSGNRGTKMASSVAYGRSTGVLHLCQAPLLLRGPRDRPTNPHQPDVPYGGARCEIGSSMVAVSKPWGSRRPDRSRWWCPTTVLSPPVLALLRSLRRMHLSQQGSRLLAASLPTAPPHSPPPPPPALAPHLTPPPHPPTTPSPGPKQNVTCCYPFLQSRMTRS